MKELFVPYNLSLSLREIGFDEPCLAVYYPAGILYQYTKKFGIKNSEREGKNFQCTAILWEQAFDWLLPKLPDYNLDQMENTFDLRYYDGKEWGYILMLSTRQACLEKLIEIKKS